MVEGVNVLTNMVEVQSKIEVSSTLIEWIKNSLNCRKLSDRFDCMKWKLDAVVECLEEINKVQNALKLH